MMHLPLAMIRVNLMTVGHLKGQLSSYEVTNIYLLITLDAQVLERHEWSRCVCLAQTHRLIYNMTNLGHVMALT